MKADNTVERRTVEVAVTQDGVAVVSKGLANGEKVVVDGQYRLNNGAKIRIDSSQQAPQQQPGTAESKLAGLRKHYNVPAKAQVYFDIHQADFEEPRWLAEQIDTLSPEEFADSREACSKMSAALWRGLDGVMSAIG